MGVVAGETQIDRAGWSRCVGCSLWLPDGSGAVETRRNSSAACWALYGEVAGYELNQLAQLGQGHQLLVDTYGAQHVGNRTPAIRVAFCLIGLQLVLVAGWTGVDVRDAHQDLARRYGTWPTFDPPEQKASLTVFDLALTSTPDEYEQVLGDWANAVWSTWESAHEQVRRLIDQRVRPRAG